MTDQSYVHGYSEAETQRLADQANTLSQLLHHDSLFLPPGTVLEAGCGTGSQTRIIAKNNPECRFVSVDISEESLAAARRLVSAENITNVEFQTADIYNLAFDDETFDHVFVCFVLEHLAEPDLALAGLKRVLKSGGSITVIEGDHGSAYYGYRFYWRVCWKDRGYRSPEEITHPPGCHQPRGKYPHVPARSSFFRD